MGYCSDKSNTILSTKTYKKNSNTTIHKFSFELESMFKTLVSTDQSKMFKQ